MGKVAAVCIGEKKGEKKKEVGDAYAIAALGIEKDAHAEGGDRQVSLLMAESIDMLRKSGVQVPYGGFAENIVTEGVDLVSLRPGDTIRIGKSCVLKVTKIGKECHSPCWIAESAGRCIMPEEGVFCTVEATGRITKGDELFTARSGGKEKKDGM